MKIIDAHHHFWDIENNYLPWLTDTPVKFRYGDYTALKRNYMPDDYLEDFKEYDVVGSVFIETIWDPKDPLGEVAWVGKVREQSKLPTVMIAQGNPTFENAEEYLAALGKVDFVRGIRANPVAAASPDKVEIGAPGSQGHADWRNGYAHLSKNGLSHDIQTPWWHLRETLDLAEAFPDTQIIINHTAMPADRSEAGLNGWHEAVKLVSKAPNVAIKISGIGEAGKPWSLETNKRIILDTINIFGIERCMFASNFPVDGLCGTLNTIYSGFFTVTENLTPAEKQALFHDNAIKYYRMDKSDLLGA